MKHVTKTLAAAVAALGLGAASVQAQANLTYETTTPGAATHATAMHAAESNARAGIANLQVLEGQTLTNSLMNIAEGRSDISNMPLILVFLLDKGRGPYSKTGAEKGAALASNVRALYPFNAGAYGLIALESEGIDSWEKLAGKNVWNGPPRGAALVNARQAAQMAAGMKDGEDYNGHQTNWGQLPSVLVDGSMDAFILPLTFPSQRVTTMQAAGDVVIVSTPKDVFESEGYRKIFNAPGNVPVTVHWDQMGYGDGIRMVSEDGNFRGIGTAFADIVHKDMSFDMAKALVAEHIKTLDELKARTAFMKNANFGILDAELSGFCGPLSLKYHPGAIAAWEEAGYTVPECAK
ncbi:MAG: TAXI family TRAP transporter solute-binding subunit [Thalassovita sp.]